MWYIFGLKTNSMAAQQWLRCVSAQIEKTLFPVLAFNNIKINFCLKICNFTFEIDFSSSNGKRKCYVWFCPMQFSTLDIESWLLIRGKSETPLHFFKAKNPAKFQLLTTVTRLTRKKKYLQRTTTAAPTFTLSLQGNK